MTTSRIRRAAGYRMFGQTTRPEARRGSCAAGQAWACGRQV